MCEKSVKRFFYAFSYVTNQYKTQQICESVVLKDPQKLQFVPNQYKAQEICEKLLIAVLIYWKMSRIAISPKKEVKKKAIDNHPYRWKHFPDQYKNQQMCKSFVFENLICYNIFLIGIKPTQNMKKLLMHIHHLQNMSLIGFPCLKCQWLLIMQVLINLLHGVIDINNARHVKKDQQRVYVKAWHPLRWWDWCIAEEEKNNKVEE